MAGYSEVTIRVHRVKCISNSVYTKNYGASKNDLIRTYGQLNLIY